MRIVFAFGLVLSLAACSGGGSAGSIGNLNPFTWFGGGSKTSTPDTLAPRRGYTQVVDYRGLIDQVTSVSIERTPGGAFVRATGLPPSLGYHNAGLVRVPSNNAGELALEFRVSPPTTAQGSGRTAQRQIEAGYFISDFQLRQIRSVRVTAARNSRTARR